MFGGPPFNHEETGWGRVIWRRRVLLPNGRDWDRGSNWRRIERIVYEVQGPKFGILEWLERYLFVLQPAYNHVKFFQCGPFTWHSAEALWSYVQKHRLPLGRLEAVTYQRVNPFYERLLR